MLELLTDPQAWASLLTLTLLEVVLGVDNLIFIAITAEKLPPAQREKARFIGLSLALLMRVGLLFSITWIIGLTKPIVTMFGFDLSWRDLILLGGGIFLLVKATKEVHEQLEGEDAHGSDPNGKAGISFAGAVVQIIILDLVFSLDSVITAVGMTDQLPIMIVAVVFAIILMLVASGPLSRFVNAHPTVLMLALSFLMLIGMSLVAEGLHFHIPKGYIYAAIAFSIGVEALNQWRSAGRKRKRAAAGQAVQLHKSRALQGDGKG
jgi:predicted tellurium resistance membrane protein TerC